MVAYMAMLILALGALLIVLCTGWGDSEDGENEDPAAPGSNPEARRGRLRGATS